jgi:hypothetical protein
MINKKSFVLIAKTVLLLIFLMVNLSCIRKKVEEAEKVISVDEYLAKQPALKFDEKIPQLYNVTSTLYNRDMEGSIVSTIQITGKVARSVESGEVRCGWSEVKIFSSRDTLGEYPDGKPLDYMNGFSYALSGEILNEDFYKDFPEEDRIYMKTLIWDAPWLEVAYIGVDEAEYNTPYFSADLESKKVQAQNFALLKMKNLKLKWVGIAKRNNEMCALIEFRTLSNPVESKSKELSVKGRSCSWGSFWVSLEDHQIEYAEVNEDVIMEMTLPGFPRGQVLNMQREVEFKKMR